METLSSAHELHQKDSTPTCFILKNAFGYSLKKAVVFVAVTAMIVSIITLVASVQFLLAVSSEMMFNSNPMKAVNLISALMCSSISVYQIVISIAMLWFLRQKQQVILLTLWTVSNITILILISFMVVTRIAICLFAEKYPLAIANAFFGILYEVVFSYFCLIVSNYEDSLDPDSVIY